MKVKLILTGLCIVCQTIAFSEIVKEVIATGEADGANENAFLQAKMKARLAAVESACGVEVYSSSLIHNHILQGDFLKSISRGQIIDEEVIEQTVRTYQASKTDLPVLKAVFRGKFRVKLKENDQPSFSAGAKLMPTKRYRAGETLHIEMNTSKDCYFHIFNYSPDGKITILYPNEKFDFLRDHFIEKNKILIWPGEKILNYVDYELTLEKGQKESLEYLIVVFSLDPLPIIYDQFNKNINLYEMADYENLARITADLPFSAYTEIILQYLITKD